MINPTIFWSQNDQFLKLRIPQPNPLKPPIVSFDEKYLKLIPEAFNIEENDTLYKLQFYDLVLPDKSNFRIGINEANCDGQYIEFQILKSVPKHWPRLLNTTDYCPFLHEQQEDDQLVLNGNEIHDRNCQKKMQNSFRKLRSNKNFGRRKRQNIITPSEMKKIYLFLYNLFQFVGFIYILVVLSIRYAKEGADSTYGSYKALGFVIKMLYLAQIQEVIYSLIDKARKGCFFLMLHLAFRYFILFVMLSAEPRMQSQHVVFHLLLIYTLMELIKYPYYMLRSFHVYISLITWIRCTISLFLYPIAFFCEGVIMFKNLPYFEETKRYSLYLPNQLNFSFHLPVFLRCYLLFGLFPFLYLTVVRLYYYRLKNLSTPIYLHKID